MPTKCSFLFLDIYLVWNNYDSFEKSLKSSFLPKNCQTSPKILNFFQYFFYWNKSQMFYLNQLFPNEILRCRSQCERPMVFPCAIATIFHFLFLCVLCRVEKEISKETGSLIECVDKHVLYTVFQKFTHPYMYSNKISTVRAPL